MDYLEGAMNAPPTAPPPRNRGVKALLAGVILVVALAVFGVSSVFAASPAPSASKGASASGAPTPNHVCDRNNSSSPSSSSSS